MTPLEYKQILDKVKKYKDLCDLKKYIQEDIKELSSDDGWECIITKDLKGIRMSPSFFKPLLKIEKDRKIKELSHINKQLEEL